MDRLRAMETFTRVVRAGSFSAAARQLGMPQGDVASALSQVLPGVVDQLTPQGEVPADLPDASQVDLGQIVGRMLQGR